MQTNRYTPILTTDIRLPVRLIQVQQNELHQRLPKHWHEGGELIYCHRGDHQVWVEGKFSLLKTGDCMYIPPYSLHEVIQIEDSHLYIMQISKDFLEECGICTNYEIFCNSLMEREKDYTSIQKTLPKIYDLTKQKNAIDHLKVKSLLYAMMSEMIQNFAYIPNNRENKNFQLHYELISEILIYIRENHHRPLKQQEVAQHFGYNSQYFARLFKKHCGVTFLEYLTNIRIETAQRQLLTTEEKIIDISEHCGFQSVKSFNAAFSKYFQLTPSKYREVNRGWYERKTKRPLL